ncbi:hypothetical protein [Rothia nasisuis]|uniref:hypothetical protein n=1 Tax=Rothia nasisuis TaxID=2109647 RepID=UPI001F2C4CD4|nr:hypothetical protein [Rothia nasisuis]
MSTLTYTRTFNSFELSLNLKPVFEAAESQPVLVTRRDGENLVLMTEREADERRDMFAIAAQIIAVTPLEGGSLAEADGEAYSKAPSLQLSRLALDGAQRLTSSEPAASLRAWVA